MSLVLNPDQQKVLDLLRYDPLTGILTWLYNSPKHRAGWADNGYRFVRIAGKKYKGHRLAFLFMLGRDPIGHVDHIDTNRSNNIWSNLRENAEKTNHWNRGLQSNNTSGVKGVHWDSRKARFIAQIQVDGRKKQVGSFLTLEEAGLAISKHRSIVHKEFANHG